MEEFKGIRTIIKGDLSKYHFLKEVITPSSWEEIWHKEYNIALAEMRIEVRAKGVSNDASICFHENAVSLTGNLPIGSMLLYPSLKDDNNECYSNTDRIVFFDEFPFREKFLLEKIKKTAAAHPYLPLSVILYYPERKNLSSDITSVESAAMEAKEKYEMEGIKANIHIPGSFPGFLYWHSANAYKVKRKELKSLPEKMTQKLEKFFSLEMELLQLDLSFIVDVNELERLTKYTPDLQGKNVNSEYAKRFIRSHLNLSSTDFMTSILSVHEEYIHPIRVWSRESDHTALMNVFRKYWDDFVKIKEERLFKGAGKEDYYQFLVDTKVGYLFKLEVSEFISKKVPQLFKEYIHENIKLFEEFVDE